ncbi:MAG TPA: restriction endonuclease subunit S, partial [Anaerolineaceae bacterium]|nr:restriction endonuclease subunit S [Anaerolineaceae bacterium]
MSDQLPEGWVWTTLGQIADAQSGAGFPKSYQGLPSGDYPLAKVSDISEATKTNGGIINKANNYLSEANAKKIGAKVFPVGTTLFAKIGEAVRLNRRAINTCPILADNNVMGLIPDTGSVTPRYLFLFMHSVDL